MAMLIFDLDGTLVDSIGGLTVSLNHMLMELGFQTYTRETCKTFVGRGIRRMVERAIPDIREDIYNHAYERMMHYYRIHYKDDLRVYEGIYELLDWLVEQGHQLALITNKNQEMAEIIMKEWFDGYPFRKIVGKNSNNPAKPDPTTILQLIDQLSCQKENTYMIGDSEVDLLAARNALVNEVWVQWGFRTHDQIADYNPAIMIDCPRELQAVLAG